MQDVNPYAAPEGDLGATAEGGYGPVRVFTAQGRLNRLRYLGYSAGLGALVSLAGNFVAGILMAANGGEPTAASLGIQFLAFGAVLWISFLLAIQRLHDFNASGWWSLLILVPLVNLIYALIPGGNEANRFGPPPPPNTAGVYVLAAVVIGLPILGIIAALAVPLLAPTV